MRHRIILTLLACLAAVGTAKAASTSLFDGKSFAGWDGDTNMIWRITDGCFIGGSMSTKIKQNEFLATTRNYTNFIIKLKFKLLGDSKKDFVNSGVQIRSQRRAGDSEMIGYQCDIGDPTWWGSIYDESRRNKLMAQSDMKSLEPVLKRGDWNDYQVHAEGRRIRTWINGVLAVDYTEADERIIQWGRIGLQIHSGGPAEAWFKDITIEELPSPKESPLTPAEQRASFTVPAGFVVELAVAEPDLPKPITVTWDDSGRMWSITATEYPVDGNENAASAEALYRNGGRDKVLVFPSLREGGRNNAAGVGGLVPSSTPLYGQPRVFADGLAMPMGVLPYKDGAIIQHGSEILFLRDTDGDGKADKREVLLSGFGIQDSHLMPHQFTWAPGGWVYLAQGAFNYSKVRTTDGVVVQFDHTKLARFRPDGSQFEVLTHGPCNIWGLAISRKGETFIQEANDYGYSVIPYEPGINIPGCGDYKFRPYAPKHPSATPFAMGGTGLSGLALNDDANGFPLPWNDVMFVANPITRMVQAVRVNRDGAGYKMEKLPDFMTTTDEWFRPVAMHFGPDGCLYVVDWYNKIISHNEVPRTHPDRDKSRGRVWRVRHESQKLRDIPDIAKASDASLVIALRSGNRWEQGAALNQIGYRKAAIPAQQTGNSAEQVIQSLRAAEAAGTISSATIAPLLSHIDRHVRREAIRALGELRRSAKVPEEEALKLAGPLAADADHSVRTEVIRTISGQMTPWKHLIIVGAEKRPDPSLGHQAIALLIRMALPALLDDTKSGPGYERAFERYLVRAGLERHPSAVAAFLKSADAASLPLENRAFASLALDPQSAATTLASLLPQLKRVPSEEEVRTLANALNDAAVVAILKSQLVDPTSAMPLLETLLKLRTSLDSTALLPLLTAPTKALLTSPAGPELALGLRLASEFQLQAAEPTLAGILEASLAPVSIRGSSGLVPALKALASLRSDRSDLFLGAFGRNEPGVRETALTALAASRGDHSAAALLGLWDKLTSKERSSAIGVLSAAPNGAKAILASLKKGQLAEDDLPASALEKMRLTLSGNADMDALWLKMAPRMKRALRLDGANGDYVETKLTLAGPFTVEAWVKLDPEISNLDGILGAPGQLDLNFYGGQFRAWVSGLNDVVVAKRKVTPESWTHVALTRDAAGEFRIYVNGELDAVGTTRSTNTFTGLDLGRTIPTQGGTAGWLAEFRVWNQSRSAEEIIGSFDRSFAGETRPAGLAVLFPGDNLKPHGKARVEGTLEAPPLLTAKEAQAVEEKFAKFRSLVTQPGDAAKGRDLFTTTCLSCHQAGGKGAGFAPNLDGSALRTTDGLLRALLTPSAAVEAGYRKFRVETTDGEIQEGQLGSEDASGVVLKRPNVEPLKIAAKDIKRARFLNESVMPEGLLESLAPQQVADLFAHLRTLK